MNGCDDETDAYSDNYSHARVSGRLCSYISPGAKAAFVIERIIDRPTFRCRFTDQMNVHKPGKECVFSEPGTLWNCMTNTMQAMDTTTLSMIEKMSGRSPKRHHKTMTVVIHINPHELRKLRSRIGRPPRFKP
jgi:hypothetical protein